MPKYKRIVGIICYGVSEIISALHAVAGAGRGRIQGQHHLSSNRLRQLRVRSKSDGAPSLRVLSQTNVAVACHKKLR